MATSYKYTSDLNFKTVHAEIVYWLANTGKYFMGGRSGSGENGNDFTMPMGTPVYAVEGGKVVGQGYYKGGGVVSIQSHPNRIWYYQHLDQNEVPPVGQTVQAGQLIGYSGGQNHGGNHPADPYFSSWQHIEVGINAPWGGPWGNNQGLPNIDPRPTLMALAGESAITSALGLSSTTSSSSGSSSDCTHSISILGQTICMDPGLDLLVRSGLIFGGFVVIILGVLLFGAGNPDVRQVVSKPIEASKQAAKVAASVGMLA